LSNRVAQTDRRSQVELQLFVIFFCNNAQFASFRTPWVSFVI